MKASNYILGGVNCLQYLFTAAQVNETFQIVELILAILTSIVLIAYRVWHWWREANADGKIDADEAKELIDIVADGVEELKEKENDIRGNNKDTKGKN